MTSFSPKQGKESIRGNHAKHDTPTQSTIANATFEDNRPQAVAQRKLREDIANSPIVLQRHTLAHEANNGSRMNALRSASATRFGSAIQKKAMTNAHGPAIALQRPSPTSNVIQRVMIKVEGYPGLFFDDDIDTYLDSDGNTYDDPADYKRRGGGASSEKGGASSSSKFDFKEEKGKEKEKEKVHKYPLLDGVRYPQRPKIRFNPVSNRDVRGISPSGEYAIVYRFADAANPASMYPYPGEKTAKLSMDKLQADSDSLLNKDHAGNWTGAKDGLHAKQFEQRAILTVGYGRNNSPFIPVGVDYHLLANHKNRLMQEIVRTPENYELDPLREEDPVAGKRAPHILLFAIPVEKGFLIFDTKSHNDQAKSAGEQEVFGPLAPFWKGWANNPY